MQKTNSEGSFKAASSEGTPATVGTRGTVKGLRDAGGYAMTFRLLASSG